MAIGIFKVLKGLLIKQEDTLTPTELEIVPGGSPSTKTILEGNQTVNRTITLPDADTTIVGTDATQTLENKTIDADLNTITNISNTEIEAGANIDRSKLASGTASRVVVNNGSGVMSDSTVTTTELDKLSGISGNLTTDINTQTLKNKTIDGDDNTILDVGISSLKTVLGDANKAIVRDGSGVVVSSFIANANIDIGAAIDATKIHDGSVSNTEFGYLGGVTSDIQTQFSGKANTTLNNLGSTAVNADVIPDSNATRDLGSSSNRWAEVHADSVQGDTSGTLNVTAQTINLNATQTNLADGSASDPGSGLAAGNVYYNSTSNKYRYYNGTSWFDLGSSNAGGINYITNSDAEADTSGYATYADAAGTSPVDGTGGTPNVTWTRSTSSPLRGSGSFLLTKDAVNRQGEGASYAFSIASTDQGKPLQINFDWALASGTFSGSVTPGTNSDVTVWIYDVTNGVIIQPSGHLLEPALSGQFYRFRSVFQAAINSTSYRLIFHVTTTSTFAYTLKFDDISVGPQVISNGAAVTDWQSYTPTGTWVTNATYSGRWRRVGDSMEITGRVLATGTPTAAQLTFSIPSGYSIDTSKVNAIGNVEPFGIAVIDDSGTGTITGNVHFNSTTAVFIKVLSEASSDSHYGRNITEIDPLTIVNTDGIYVNFKVPISGWSSNVQMSNDTDTRVVAWTGQTSSTQSLASGVVTQITGWSSIYDTHNAFSSNAYTVPVSGKYRVKFDILFSPATTTSLGSIQALLYKNGVGFSTQLSGIQTTSSVIREQKFIATFDFNAGDVLTFRAYQDGGSTLTLAGGIIPSIASIERISGPSQIASSEVIGMSATTASGQSFTTTSASTITFNAVSLNTHGIINTSTGVVTIPISGLYRISAMAQLDTGAVSVAFNTRLDVRVNSSAVRRGIIRHFGSTTSSVQPRATFIRRLNAGDTVDVQLFQDSGSTLALTTDATFHDFSIERIG